VETEAILHQNTESHSVLAGLSYGRVRELTLPVYETIARHRVAVVNDPWARDELIAGDHRAIAQSVSGGHYPRARELMFGHINAVADFSGERLGDNVDDHIEWL
jgi:DNA-binding FadR family transcriptional regulator